jgi:TfoX/Sxy family transcriptional regulator of competence genes
MEWKKAPAELVEFLAGKMKNVNCDYKKMFGYPAYFINGNMFVGVHGDKLFLRLSDADIADIMKNCNDVTYFEPMPGRAMKGYVVLPKTVYSNSKLFHDWLDKSIKYVSSLPAKGKKLK